MNVKKISEFFDYILPVGPRSVLIGAHCFFIHPFFVAAAWAKLYGFPTDPRLWVAFFVHDLGYLFQWCRNMDGDEGETHVEFGANLMHFLFDRELNNCRKCKGHQVALSEGRIRDCPECFKWRNFALYHSRFYARRDNAKYSQLCPADKLAVALEPYWLYIFRVTLTGEIKEYMARAGGNEGSKYKGEPIVTEYQETENKSEDKYMWWLTMTNYLSKFAYEHKDGKPDTWTPKATTNDS